MIIKENVHAAVDGVKQKLFGEEENAMIVTLNAILETSLQLIKKVSRLRWVLLT